MGNLRFRSSAHQYRWIALGSFAVIMGISGALAYRLAPPPGFMAQGTLTSNNPPVKFSTTGTTILKQGEQLTPEVLLADNVVKAGTTPRNCGWVSLARSGASSPNGGYVDEGHG